MGEEDAFISLKKLVVSYQLSTIISLVNKTWRTTEDHTEIFVY